MVVRYGYDDDGGVGSGSGDDSDGSCSKQFHIRSCAPNMEFNVPQQEDK